MWQQKNIITGLLKVKGYNNMPYYQIILNPKRSCIYADYKFVLFIRQKAQAAICVSVETKKSVASAVFFFSLKLDDNMGFPTKNQS